MDIILCTKEQASNYLAHYGVPGMKKGVLRWTNKDGTLTEEGKRHYGIGVATQKAGSFHNVPNGIKISTSSKNMSSNSASSKDTSSKKEKPKFTFSAEKSNASTTSVTRSVQNERNFPSSGRKKNITGKAKYTTTGDAVATNGPVSGQANDSIQYEAYSNYLKELLPAAANAQKEGMNLHDYEEKVDSVPGNLAKEYLLESGILPPDVIGLFHDEMLQFFFNRWMANPNSKFSQFVNERAAESIKRKKK
jgi:hypothetical protein